MIYPRIYLFAGTTEGRQIAECLDDCSIPTTVFVATDYGASLLKEGSALSIRVGRMDRDQMMEAIEAKAWVIDATHPYAQLVTNHIKEVSKIKNCRYFRVVREEQKTSGWTMKNTQEAVDYLSQNEGRALLAIGVKELDAFTAVPDYQHRIFPRVLPDEQSLLKCSRLGFPKSSIIALQGPFSESLNVELLRHYACQYLVTKESGEMGGFVEKNNAARRVGAKLIVIQRPTAESGWDVESLIHHLKRVFLRNTYRCFPLFIRSLDKTVLIVGGGRVAQRRLLSLLSFDFNVKLVAPEVSDGIRDCATEGRVRLFERPFEWADLSDVFMVLAATSDDALNERIGVHCCEAGIWVSVASKKEAGNFYFPALAGQGAFLGAVTSQGEDYKALVKGMRAFKTALEENGQRECGV